MKKQVNTAIAGLILATASITSMATEVGGTYVTAGAMKISTDELDELKSISGISVDDKDSAVSFVVGYQFDKNIAFEAGVISEYDVSASATTASGSAATGTLDGKSYSIPAATTFTLSAKFDTGYTLGTKFSSSINESFDMYGKVGMYFWESDLVLSSDNAIRYDGSDYTNVTLATEDGSDVYYGIGGSYKVDPTTSINADYMKIKAAGADADSIGLSVSFDI